MVKILNSYLFEKKFNKKCKSVLILLNELKQIIKIIYKTQMLLKFTKLLTFFKFFLFCFEKICVIKFIYNDFYAQNLKHLKVFILLGDKFIKTKLSKLRKKLFDQKITNSFFEFFVGNLLTFFAGSNYSFFPNKFSVFLASGLKDDSCLIKNSDFWDIDTNLLDLKNIYFFSKKDKFTSLDHIKEFVHRGNFVIFNKSPKFVVSKTFVFKFIKYNRTAFRYLRFNYSYGLALFLYSHYKMFEFLQLGCNSKKSNNIKNSRGVNILVL